MGPHGRTAAGHKGIRGEAEGVKGWVEGAKGPRGEASDV